MSRYYFFLTVFGLSLLVAACGDVTNTPIPPYSQITTQSAATRTPIISPSIVSSTPNVFAAIPTDFGIKKPILAEGSSGHSSFVYKLAYSQDGKMLASIDFESVLKVWRVSDWSLLATLRGVTVAFSSDGKYLATSEANMIKLWDIAENSPTRFKEVVMLKTSKPRANNLAFHPKSSVLVSASSDSNVWGDDVQIWDIEKKQEVQKLSQANIFLVFSPDGKYLVTGDNTKFSDNTKVGIILWDATNWRKLTNLGQNLNLNPNVAAFSSDGKFLAIGTRHYNTGDIIVWDISRGLNDIRQVFQHNGKHEVASLAFVGDNKTLLTTGFLVEPTGATRGMDGVPLSLSGGHSDQIIHRNSVQIWDIPTQKLLSSYEGRNDVGGAMALNSDGKTFAAAKNSSIQIHNIANYPTPIKILEGTFGAQAFAFEPRKRLIAVAGNTGVIKLLEAATGKELVALTGHTASVETVTFSPDGKLLASGSQDDTVRIWDVATQKELFSLTPHKSWVNAVTFSLDGKFFASASSDTTVILWEVSSTGFKQITSFSRPLTAFWSLAFSFDNKFLAAGSNLGIQSQDGI
jgi:WD40 repeat protein